jgi:hypothetical protein
MAGRARAEHSELGEYIAQIFFRGLQVDLYVCISMVRGMRLVQHTCFTATISPVALSMALYTIPNEPLPSSSSIWYLAASTSPSASSLCIRKGDDGSCGAYVGPSLAARRSAGLRSDLVCGGSNVAIVAVSPAVQRIDYLRIWLAKYRVKHTALMIRREFAIHEICLD